MEFRGTYTSCYVSQHRTKRVSPIIRCMLFFFFFVVRYVTYFWITIRVLSVACVSHHDDMTRKTDP